MKDLFRTILKYFHALTTKDKLWHMAAAVPIAFLCGYGLVSVINSAREPTPEEQINDAIEEILDETIDAIRGTGIERPPEPRVVSRQPTIDHQFSFEGRHYGFGRLPETDEASRQTRINSQFNYRTGRHRGLERYARSLLDDSLYFEHDSTSHHVTDRWITVTMIYYTRNRSYRDLKPWTITAHISFDGVILSVPEHRPYVMPSPLEEPAPTP